MGRRSCPGTGLAHRVVGLVLASLIPCFEWERISDEQIDLTEGKGLSMPKAEPLEAMSNVRVFAGERVATSKFTNFYEGIKDSGPSRGGKGHGDTPSAQKFKWAGVDDSGSSPGDRGHGQSSPAQKFDWSGVKDSGPSHGGIGHGGNPLL
ncbi:hypothetical protein POM88_039341 [Heracleum sosnowskyi]|uniref:Uncharacterized protein n=1 Tax=Heracleum sosnowskyi TaxID=360622 RepID=A0AAD8M6B5_9APIA|nr:hypothetical protein POM88_039341 [Heracleum sosnowskyi]